MYFQNMVSWHMSLPTGGLSLCPISSNHWANYCKCNYISPQDTTQRVMVKWNGQTKSWNRCIQTINRMTGPNYCPSLNLATTMPPMPPQGCHHSLQTKDTTQSSLCTCMS